MSIESKINKQKQKAKKELISFIKFILIYVIVVALITHFYFQILNASVELTPDNTHTITGVLDEWKIKKGTGGKHGSSTKVFFTIDGNDYVCYRQHVKECLTDLSVGDIVTVTIETNERHVEDKAVFIYGFTHNGKIIYDVREANEGIWFIKFVILPIFVIAEIIAGIALIVRVVVFIRTICKRSSMIKAYKTKRENLN